MAQWGKDRTGFWLQSSAAASFSRGIVVCKLSALRTQAAPKRWHGVRREPCYRESTISYGSES